MHHFTYRSGVLHAEDVPLPRIAEQVGTPFYCYSKATFCRHLKVMGEAFSKGAGGMAAPPVPTLIAYAMKANSNQAMLRLVARAGHGADVVSLGELERALAAGIAPQKIIFSGVAKSSAELERALAAGIKCINVESAPELERLAAVAAGLGRVAPVSVRINPNVDARTHEKIATGKAENKFGIPYDQARSIYARIRQMDALAAVGVDMHIGSQITELDPFRNAFVVLRDLVGALKADGHAIAHVDVGGGLGIPYANGATPPPDPTVYAKTVLEHLSDLGCELIVEPGRVIAGNAGILVTRVEYVKSGAERSFVIADAGMNDFIRPTLYEAAHEIWPVRENTTGENATIFGDLVGPVCETGDYLARSVQLPVAREGDLLAVMGAGAYGAVMSSAYNSRPLIAEVLVDGDRFHVIRPRQTIADLIALDSVPHWLA
jgi:diaminopimelate decarboxylase